MTRGVGQGDRALGERRGDGAAGKRRGDGAAGERRGDGAWGDERRGAVRLGMDACTLPTAERPLRVAEFDALATQTVLRAERLEPTRLRLDLTPSPEVAARVAELAARETQCCSFFTFSLTLTGEKLSLEVTAPAAHTAVLDGLAALLTPSA